MGAPYVIPRRAPLPEELRPRCAFDVDDFSFDFMGVCCRLVGMDYQQHHCFYVENNLHYTLEQKIKMIAVFGTTVPYNGMQFYPGFEDVMRPAQDLDATVFFATNCPTKDIANAKRFNIHDAIEIPDEQILTFLTGGVIGEDDPAHHKTLPPRLLVYGDDAIHHLVEAQADYLIGMNKPWNIDPKLRAELAGRKVYWVEDGDFRAVNQIAYDLCAEHIKQVRS